MFKDFKKNVLSAVALLSLPFLLLGIANPALAFKLTLQFCGDYFETPDPDDGVLQSRVTLEINDDGTINTSAGTNGILDADISTIVGNVELNYTEDDLFSFELGATQTAGTPMDYGFSSGLSDYWLFDDGNNNIFSFVLPNSVDLLDVQEIETTDIAEFRSGVFFKDKDKVQRVPEPSVVFASLAFVGLMTMVRDRQKK